MNSIAIKSFDLFRIFPRRGRGLGLRYEGLKKDLSLSLSLPLSARARTAARQCSIKKTLGTYEACNFGFVGPYRHRPLNPSSTPLLYIAQTLINIHGRSRLTVAKAHTRVCRNHICNINIDNSIAFYTCLQKDRYKLCR